MHPTKEHSRDVQATEKDRLPDAPLAVASCLALADFRRIALSSQIRLGIPARTYEGARTNAMRVVSSAPGRVGRLMALAGRRMSNMQAQNTIVEGVREFGPKRVRWGRSHCQTVTPVNTLGQPCRWAALGLAGKHPAGVSDYARRWTRQPTSIVLQYNIVTTTAVHMHTYTRPTKSSADNGQHAAAPSPTCASSVALARMSACCSFRPTLNFGAPCRVRHICRSLVYGT